MEKELIEQIEESYVASLNSLKSDGTIQDFNVKQRQISDDEIIFDISILPKHGIKRIATNFTITKEGVRFDDEKK